MKSTKLSSIISILFILVLTSCYDCDKVNVKKSPPLNPQIKLMVPYIKGQVFEFKSSKSEDIFNLHVLDRYDYDALYWSSGGVGSCEQTNEVYVNQNNTSILLELQDQNNNKFGQNITLKLGFAYHDLSYYFINFSSDYVCGLGDGGIQSCLYGRSQIDLGTFYNFKSVGNKIILNHEYKNVFLTDSLNGWEVFENRLNTFTGYNSDSTMTNYIQSLLYNETDGIIQYTTIYGDTLNRIY